PVHGVGLQDCGPAVDPLAQLRIRGGRGHGRCGHKCVLEGHAECSILLRPSPYPAKQRDMAPSLRAEQRRRRERGFAPPARRHGSLATRRAAATPRAGLRSVRTTTWLPRYAPSSGDAASGASLRPHLITMELGSGHAIAPPPPAGRRTGTVSAYILIHTAGGQASAVAAA